MARHAWKITLPDGGHAVELEHGYVSGKRRLVVDGTELPETGKKSLLDFGSDHPFAVAGHPCVITIRSNGFVFRYDLFVDGRSVSTGRPHEPLAPIPWWAWFFFAACLGVPVYSMGGAVPGGLGAAGAVGCLYLARLPGRGAWFRALACVLATAAAWGAFLGFLELLKG